MKIDGKRDHQTCHYCELTHPHVEAGGVYHCPNPLCPGCGAAYWRLRARVVELESLADARRLSSKPARSAADSPNPFVDPLSPDQRS